MRACRLVPAAITPVHPRDIASSVGKRGARARFEQALAGFFDRAHAFTFGSLMRTVYACFVGLRRDSARRKVVLPRYSCPSFVHGVLAAGLEPIYCDVEPETLAIDLESLARLELDEVLAVVCANLFGLTSEVDRICELCRPRGVAVVEGVDYGLGTRFRGRRIGSFGDVAILNFQEGKALPVGGGAVVSSLPVFQQEFGGERAASRSNLPAMCGFVAFSRPRTYWCFTRLTALLRVPRKRFSMEDTIRKTNSETDFQFDPTGFDKGLSDFQGALGLRLLDRLDVDLRLRKERADWLTERLRGVSGITLVAPHPATDLVHHIRCPILVHDGRRDDVMRRMMAAGIEASPMYVEHGMHVDETRYPGAARVARELLTLPCHPFVTERDVDVMAEVLASA